MKNLKPGQRKRNETGSDGVSSSLMPSGQLGEMGEMGQQTAMTNVSNA